MKIFLVYFILIFFPVGSFCQQVNQAVFEVENLNMLINSKNILLENLAQPSTGHQVFIEQIGSYNVAEAKVVSEKNNLNINQHGNQNTILMEVMSKSTTGNITQTGNQNYSLDFAHDPTQEINLDLTQNGNGHHFERYGSNSIGNNLKFEMTGESQTIIVRNFK